MNSKIAGFVVILTALTVPFAAVAADSSGLRPANFTARASESYVKTDLSDCIAVAKSGRTVEGHTFGGSSSEAYTTACPRDKPVTVSISRGYRVQSGVLSALTGMSQATVVTCCPVGTKWVDLKKQDPQQPNANGVQAS